MNTGQLKGRISLNRTLLSFLILILATTTILLAGCQKKTTEKGENLVFGLENEITTLDPIRNSNIYELQVMGQIYEGLVGLDKNNQLIPLLAESWAVSSDFKTWKFRIRKGVYFHEDPIFGPNLTREVEAEDVRYSFQRILSKQSTSSFALVEVIKGAREYQAGKIQNVSGLRVIAPDTFVIELEQPEPFFINRITSPLFSIFPKEAVDLGADIFGKTKAIGTGPFRLVHKSDVEVILERNPKYWRKTEGNVKQLKFLVIKNDQIRLTELKNNKIAMMAIPLSLASAIVDRGKGTPSSPVLKPPFNESYKAAGFKTFNIHFIGLNCEKMDVHLRRAISLAINRKELTRIVTAGTGTVVPGPIPPGIRGYQTAYQDDIFNLEGAKMELKKSKYDPAKDKIELLVHEKGNSEQIGQLVQDYLSKIGIKVILKRLDFNSVIGMIIKGEATAFSMFIEYVFSSPEPMLNVLFHSSKIPVPNFWRYNNPQMDEGIETLRKIGNRTEANALARKLEKLAVDDAPAVFLYQLNNLVIYRKDISNVAYNGHNIPIFSEIAIK